MRFYAWQNLDELVVIQRSVEEPWGGRVSRAFFVPLLKKVREYIAAKGVLGLEDDAATLRETSKIFHLMVKASSIGVS
jgi:hypothetical protein